MTFRLAEVADAAALGDFMTRNFLAAYGHTASPDNVQAAVQANYAESAQLRQILDENRYNWIALSGNEWVGHAQLHKAGPTPEPVAVLPTIEV